MFNRSHESKHVLEIAGEKTKGGREGEGRREDNGCSVMVNVFEIAGEKR